MKPRHPNLEWIKKVLADLEREGDPQIAAFMDRQMGDHQMSGLVETAPPPARGVKPAQKLLESSPPHFKP
jgi:hypothetical protein